MRKLATATLALAFLLGAVLAAPAQGAFGLDGFDVTFTKNAAGAPELRAGAHPFAMTTTFGVNTTEDATVGEIPDEPLRHFTFEQIEGLVGNPTAVPTCSTLEFLYREDGINGGECHDSSALGFVELIIIVADNEPVPAPIYNLPPPPGVAAKFGFWAANTPITIEAGVNDEYPYNIVARGRNVPQTVPFYSAEATLWGNPASSDHDDKRGGCLRVSEECSADIPVKPFLTVPRSCEEPGKAVPRTDYEVVSWLSPPSIDRGSVPIHNQIGAPEDFSGCEALGFKPEIETSPTVRSAESPTGLDFGLTIKDEQLVSPTGRADSEIKEAIVTLPEGMTANPSLAEGLEACSESDVEGETAASDPGEGCPQASKIGNVEVETPLLEDEILKGELFVAEPFENPFDSLLALYMTVKSPRLGIGITLAGEVAPDPDTGQLVTTFGGPGTDPLPQLPFSDFRLRFREGGRSPLITPPSCGTYEVEAKFIPWADPDDPLTRTSRFRVSEGVGGGACPSGGQPFEPGFAAGAENNAAGAFSPFAMRLTRRDGDADLTRFDAVLPPGVSGKLAGVSKCPEAQIAIARGKTGKAEQASPSCPLNSRIGHLVAGAGVGSQLVYVPGTVYLAGPFAGAPLSVVAMTPAVAGPFDVGNVVVRQALTVDPVTAQVTVDGSRSERIPRILAGIPLRVRDIQVFVDRAGFTINPTSCKRSQVMARISGEAPVARTVPFQAAGCAALPFKPRIGLRLRGGTRRGANPSLLAVLRPRPGNANIARTVVRLPRSAFLDQSHIRTICTRVQFAADRCPKRAIYGRVAAFSPLLDEPLRGPAYLRSSNNLLPDLVFDLRGIVDIEAAARIDSKRGGIRATFPAIPDAPLSKVVVRMQGGKRGLIVNSRHLCRGKSRANVRFDGHNSKRHVMRPVVRPVACKRKARRSGHVSVAGRGR